MILVIVGIILGFIYGINSDEFLFNKVIIIFFLIWGAIAGFILSEIIGCVLPTKEVVTEQEIYEIEDSKYLSIAYINGTTIYEYVINTEKGKHVEKIKTDSAYIKEGKYKPIIKIYNIVFQKNWYYWFAHDWFAHIFTDRYYVEFYIPENTIG